MKNSRVVFFVSVLKLLLLLTAFRFWRQEEGMDDLVAKKIPISAGEEEEEETYFLRMWEKPIIGRDKFFWNGGDSHFLHVIFKLSPMDRGKNFFPHCFTRKLATNVSVYMRRCCM